MKQIRNQLAQNDVHPADVTALDASANYYPGRSAEEPAESGGATAQPPLPLNNLSLMAIESELVRELNFDKLINLDFFFQKVQRKAAYLGKTCLTVVACSVTL